ncbi:MAG: mechanosensitive ion channel family protein, partial [Planctomycetes bacterium]|nr:mechanosensitive ion channel family protein [Planctomycetota bacterium]
DVRGARVRDAIAAVAAAGELRVRLEHEAGLERAYCSFDAVSSVEALFLLAQLGELQVEEQQLGQDPRPLYAVGRTPRSLFSVDPWHVLYALGFLLTAFLADRVLDAFLRRQEQASRMGALRFKQVAPLVRVAVWVVALLNGLLILLRVPASTALALTGGGLLLIGFASREIAANFIGGVAVALDRPLYLGDYVTVGGWRGEVTRIGLRSTQLVTLEDTTVTVPNRVVATSAVASANYGGLEALIPVSLYVAHDAPIEEVRSLVWEGVVTSAYCAWRRPVHVLFEEERWATRVVAHAYVFDVRHQLLFVSDVTQRVKQAFRERGIDYPRPWPASSTSAIPGSSSASGTDAGSA